MIIQPVKEIRKPWGRELWVAVTDQYALKIITLNAGRRTSLQYHRFKHEHIYMDSGRAKVEFTGPEGTLVTAILGPGEILENAPGKWHRLEALEEVRFFEVQTPFLDDVVRIEDDHAREAGQ